MGYRGPAIIKAMSPKLLLSIYLISSTETTVSTRNMSIEVDLREQNSAFIVHLWYENNYKREEGGYKRGLS
jgi:hypothetical protein